MLNSATGGHFVGESGPLGVQQLGEFEKHD